jgi:hypothetical protein
VVPDEVVTATRWFPKVAVGAIVRVTVIEVALATRTSLTVMPVPSTETLVVPDPVSKFVPVKRYVPVDPRRPVAGAIDARVGGCATTLN